MKVRSEVQGLIFRGSKDEREILLVKKLSLKTHRYSWRLLKGGVETGETEKQALKREIFEEAGLRNVQILDKIHSYRFFFGNVQHTVSSFLVEADPHENVRPGRAEVVDYTWIPKQRALEMLYWKDEKEAVKRLE
jgi:8-oxo-dGTP pyrophosphatase MutT (NUDIX family)